MRAKSPISGVLPPLDTRYPEIYANHVALAEFMRSWSARMEPELTDFGRRQERFYSEDDYLLGYMRALRDLADHLVLGDALPDGPMTHGPIAQPA